MPLRLLITQTRSELSQSLMSALQPLLAIDDLIYFSDVTSLESLNINCVLNCSMLDQQYPTALAETQIISRFCRQHKIPLIHLSSYRVFSAIKKNIHNEKDQPQPISDEDKQWMIAEELSATAEKHIILRTSWLIGPEGHNLLTQLLSGFLNGARINVHQDLRGAPTSVDDLARVLAAIIKQIHCGADNWGVMHYCSSDHCSEEEFAEQILQHLIQYQLLTAEPSLQLIDADEEDRSVSAILACRRLRECFGIQGRSWRPNLLLLIKEWLANKNKQGADS
ncbi:MAG: sugar nucleotide-binding protein [Cellvibrio sp.]|nr:sugar nucleotide-binding protein [Cellvibrio sp.]